MFEWTPQSIDWYRRAAEYGTFHRDLAALLTPHLNPGGTLCDLGCGLGYLATTLADRGWRVTAADLDPHVLEQLRRRMGPGERVELLQGDALHLPPRRWDTLVLCFFGRLTQEGHLETYLDHCNRRLVSVVSATRESAISPSGSSSRKEKEQVDQVVEFLGRRGIPFALTYGELDFGQPLADPREALRFVRHFAPDATEQAAEAHVKTHLEPLAEGGFYLKNQKKFGIITIEK